MAITSGLMGQARIRSRSRERKKVKRRSGGGMVPSSGGMVPRPAPARRHVHPPRRTYSAPSYSAPTYSGGGGRGGGVRRAPRPRPKPKPPPLKQFLRKDAAYQDQLRQFQRTWQDFLADVRRRSGDVREDFTTGRRQMKEQRVRDLEQLEEDFAARGLLKSGLYGERVGDYEEDFQERVSDLTTNRNRLLQDIRQERQQFRREQQLSKQKARKSAARRRASKYGI